MSDDAKEGAAVPRVIFLHGLSREEAVSLMRAAKAVLPDPEGLAFSMATPSNLEWRVRDLVEHVAEEHAYMREHGKPKPD